MVARMVSHGEKLRKRTDCLRYSTRPGSPTIQLPCNALRLERFRADVVANRLADSSMRTTSDTMRD